MPNRYPVEISRAPDHSLAIRWDDGHETVIPLNTLREFCPCATCRQTRKERAAEKAAAGGRRTLTVLGATTRFELAGLEHIGHYALGVNWQDDHRSIFAYDYLSDICPCAECSEARGGPPRPLMA
jgi:DUF971 family protein